jgi:hypothetical protein
MIENKCDHFWKKHTNAVRVQDVGAIPAYFICEKCNTLMTAPEVFQLEALENQNKTLKHIKGFQSHIAITAVIISFIALIVSIFS